jgi:long-chain acyl-CoA synthetase
MPQIRKEMHRDRMVSCYAERPRHVNAMLQGSFAQSVDGLALVDGDARLSYRELAKQAAILAAYLSRRGVAPGDRVAVMLPNGLDAVLSVIAVSWMGAVLVPLGTRLRRTEIGFILDDAQPVAVIHGAQFAEELPPADPFVRLRLNTGSETWHNVFNAAPSNPLPAADVSEHDLFGILYTSGTTGKPKGAMLTHFNVVHSCLHWEHAHRLTRDERTLLVVHWSHVAGLCGVVLPFLHVGATLVTMADFQRRDFLRLAQDERITHALMVPAMYGLCLLDPTLSEYDLSSWRLGAYGSAPMPEPTIRRFAQACPQLQMCNCYGATETTSPATMMPPGDGVAHAESIGKTVPCGDIRVMDEHGRELPVGEEDEFWIGGPMVVPGYWRNPQANEAAFAAGYWKSGDIGAIDAQGFVRIAERKKDMINRGGFKVYPAEVESVLTELDGVREVALVGQPDDVLGERVVAFVNAAPGHINETQVREWCRKRMADYKVPDRVVIADVPLPRNANGKIQKAELRAMAAQLPGRTQRHQVTT